MVRIKIKDQENEIALWKQRTSLALRKGRPDLQTQAEVKSTEAMAYLDTLRGEESGYIRELSDLKQEFKQAKIQENLSFDYTQILTELELLMEEPDETARKLRILEADLALEELKKKMKKERTDSN